MKKLSIPYTQDVLVGMQTSDDAGVYKISNDLAIVQTLDFITPIVDDPFTFGKIAATNSISDIFAMGGTPITAMNIVCFPVTTFDMDVLERILLGGLEVMQRAGVQLIGGHSIDDLELKYGLSVTGLIHPQKIYTNVGLHPDDVIILTKPIGTGTINTAIKAGIAEKTHIEESIRSMTTLNNCLHNYPYPEHIHALTDVTGFGLIGHLLEMAGKDSIAIRVDSASLPILPGALDYAAMGLLPAGLYRNRDFVGNRATVSPNISRQIADLVFDPQTSGGLLIAVSPSNEAQVKDYIAQKALCTATIARCEKATQPHIYVA
ncbi:MAG: selenide, water dikinase SelD [Spirochaetota bacterium]